MLCQLMDQADELYSLAQQRFPQVDEILKGLKDAKAAGGFKRNDDWEFKYSAMLLQLGLIDITNLAERNQLTPESAAGAWLEVRVKFFTGLGVVQLGEDALLSLNETFVPAEAFWLALLESNYGQEFSEAFQKARFELAERLNEEEDN